MKKRELEHVLYLKADGKEFKVGVFSQHFMAERAATKLKDYKGYIPRIETREVK